MNNFTHITSRVVQNVGIISLNRMETLNAVNISLVCEAVTQLDQWANLPAPPKAVILNSTSPKAFSAGGDLKTILAVVHHGKDWLTRAMYDQGQHVYSLICKVANSQIPTIAAVNGICMGTGSGLMCHSQHKFVTERATFAMPETAIGIFPDAAVSMKFASLPQNLGSFLAVTGHRLKGSCIMNAGLTPYFIESKFVEEVERDLCAIESPSEIPAVLAGYHGRSEGAQVPFSLGAHLGLIDRAFGQDTMEGVCSVLRQDGSQWALEQLEVINKMSPTGMKAALERVKRARDEVDVFEAISNDSRLLMNLGLKSEDFKEGLLAMAGQKAQPAWSPASLEDVDLDQIKSYFSKMPEGFPDFNVCTHYQYNQFKL